MKKLDYNDVFSYTKGLRLRLEHISGPDFRPSPEESIDLNDLYDVAKLINNRFMNYIYGETNDNSQDTKRLSSLVSVKKQWLKMFFKVAFYAQGKGDKKDMTISSLHYTHNEINDWFERWTGILEELKEILHQADHRKERRSDIARIISELGSKHYLYFVSEFCKHSNHKNDDSAKIKLQESIDKFSKHLDIAMLEYLPSQTAGLMVSQSSMNYFSVNKRPKEYGKLLDELYSQFNELDEEYQGQKVYKAEQKSKLYELILEYKNIDKITEVVKNECKLFDENNSNVLKKVADLTIEIEALNKQKDNNNNLSKEVKEKLSRLKKERGFYFIKSTRGKQHSDQFNKYCEYCDTYKNLALKRGQVLAKIKGIEREKIESENLKHWALIVELSNHDRFLWLIPKEEMQRFNQILVQLGKGNCIIYRPHSLTMRALHKLCFAEESSFVENMPPELKEKQSAVKKATNDEEKLNKGRKYNSDLKTKDELMLGFLKQVVTSDYAKKQLDIDRYDLSTLEQSTTLNDFEARLEEVCYKLEEINATEEELNLILNKLGIDISVFKITSYDLEKRNLNTHQTEASKAKRHTSEIWDAFWRKDSNIRLNPEIKIRFRQASETMVNYLESKGFNLSEDGMNNRYTKDQYTVNFTFTLNAGKRYPKLAFVKPEDICKEINAFNTRFNEQNWERSYKFGIDRGNIELATLCIAKFDKNDTYRYQGKTFLKPSFPNGEEDIVVYKLRPEFYGQVRKSDMETKPIEERNEKRVVANLSYFIDKVEDETWFEKQSCSCIDLSTAKVIKGKIINNGDLLTFLKLKKEAAKHILFELVANGIITSENKELKWASDNPEESDPIQLKYAPFGKDDVVYYFEDHRGRNLKGLLVKDGVSYTKEDVLNNFQTYVNELVDQKARKSKDINKHVPEVNKLNHLRDALVANMVGVISFLMQRYPGIVILEDLDHKLMMRHFEQLNINISTRLEYALIQKFQTMGIIPPHIKDFQKIRELSRQNNKNKSSQFGALVFVDESGTSVNCPYCGKKWDWDTDEKNKLKFQEHRYKCGKESCGYDSKNISDAMDFLKDIDDPDKIAAFNVAGKIKDYHTISGLDVSKPDSQNRKANVNKNSGSFNKRNHYTKNKSSVGLQNIKLSQNPFAELQKLKDQLEGKK